jgi:hypothetical protein
MKANIGSTWVRVGVVVLVLSWGLGLRAYGFAGGTGEPNDPYQIATAADLLSINADPNLLKKSFMLLNDLDLDPNLPGGQVFPDAVIRAPFRGTLDGGGHAIRHLCIAAKKGSTAGLFAEFNGLAKDLHLTDVQISGSQCGALACFTPEATILRCSVTGKVSSSSGSAGGLIGEAWKAQVLYCESGADVSGGLNVGGLAGYAIPGAQIAQSRATGTVTGTSSVGGLLGYDSGVTIVDCTSACKVMGVDQVGGLVGAASFQGVILRCDVQADVSGGSKVGGLGGSVSGSQVAECRAAGTVAGNDSVGGLIGSAWQVSIRSSASVCHVTAQQTAGGLLGSTSTSLSVVDCYARGSTAGSIIGGLIGKHDEGVGFPAYLVNSYAACIMQPVAQGQQAPVVGGLFGSRTLRNAVPAEIACFWDAELSQARLGTGSGPACSGTGLTTKQMQQQSTFQQARWDLDRTWTLPADSYPVLQWELAAEAGQRAQN